MLKEDKLYCALNLLIRQGYQINKKKPFPRTTSEEKVLHWANTSNFDSGNRNRAAVGILQELFRAQIFNRLVGYEYDNVPMFASEESDIGENDKSIIYINHGLYTYNEKIYEYLNYLMLIDELTPDNGSTIHKEMKAVRNYLKYWEGIVGDNHA